MLLSLCLRIGVLALLALHRLCHDAVHAQVATHGLPPEKPLGLYYRYRCEPNP